MQFICARRERVFKEKMSENTSANLNVRSEVQNVVNSTGENPNMEHTNTKEENRIVKEQAAILENPNLAAEAVSLNSELQCDIIEETSPTSSETTPKRDEAKCDICSTVDVENITNSLAEKVNIKSDEPCTSITSEENLDTPVIFPEKLVNMVKTLNMPEANPRANSKKSCVVLKQESDSLKNLWQYDSSSSDEADEEEEEEEEEQVWPFPTGNKINSDSDDSEESDDTSSSDEEDEDDVQTAKDARSKADSPISEELTSKICAENDDDDFPPILDVSSLDIDMEKEEFLHMGHIEAVIGSLVTIEAIPGMPAYDLDTCLFVEDKTLKRPLGAIYDVIGPVLSPLYCIRFIYASEISKMNIKKGMKVFCAPKSKYTKYVFVKELMKHKGTDASWVGDVELPPEIAAQLSDDECQPESDEIRKAQKRKHGSQERYRRFEEDMNRCNTLNTHAVRLVEGQRQGPRISRYNDHAQRVLFSDAVSQNNRLPPAFDPTVPPPGFHSFPRMRGHNFNWQMPVTSLRPPRCHLFEQNQSYSNSYTNNDTNHGPGPSFQRY